MRYLSIVGIITVMLFMVPSLVTAEQVVDHSKNPSYVLVMSGKSGTAEGNIMTLNGVPNVVYFTDRPARIAGHTSLENFVESWNKGSNVLHPFCQALFKLE